MMAAGVLLAAATAVVGGVAGANGECTHLYPPGVHKVELDRRFFLLLVPEGLPTDREVPIVVDTPGFSESPYYQMELTALLEYLSIYQWVGVIPFGSAVVPTETCCPAGIPAAECESGVTLDKQNPCSFNAGGCCGHAKTAAVDDVGFTRRIVGWARENMCVDEKHTFATGFSNGGMMSNRLGCEAADLFSMVAPVAGNVRIGGDLTACDPARPVGWVSLCGTEDSACNRDFEETAKEWSKRNKCADRDPVPTFTTATTACYKFEDCAAHTEYCVLDGLDHEWPGRPRPDGTSPEQPSTNVDATAFIFQRYAATLGLAAPAAVNMTAQA